MAIKIGVISDTHLEAPVPLLREVVKKFFAETDLVLHAGDLVALDVLEAFAGHKLVAVAGNMDGPEVRERLPEKEIVEVEGFRIGLIHGWGSPVGLEKRVESRFENIHCLVYGHSHRPRLRRDPNGFVCFNPGSFSPGFFSGWRRTIGILTVGREIHAEIIRL